MTTIGATPPVPAADDRPRRRPLIGIYVGVGLLLIAVNLRIGVAAVGPVLSTIERGLGVTPAVASLLTTIPVFAFGAFAFLTPPLTRHVGLDRLLALSMAAVALGVGCRLFASPVALFGGTVLVGAAIAIGNVCMPAAIKQYFDHRVGVMMGLYSTALFVGAAVAAGFTVPLMSVLGGSWRGALGVWAIPAIVALVVWLPRAFLKSRQLTSDRPGGETPLDLGQPRLVRLFGDRVAWAVTGFMGLQSLSYYAVLTWVPTILQDAGMSGHDAGIRLSFMSFPGMVAALVTPAIARRLRRTWLPVALSTAVGVLGLVGVVVAPHSGASWLWMTLLGVSSGISIALSLSYIVLRSPDHRHTGQLSTMAQGIGYLLAGLGPLGLGVLHAATDGWVVPVSALIALLIVQLTAGVAASRERHVLGASTVHP